jgi:hypothetical protein
MENEEEGLGPLDSLEEMAISTRLYNALNSAGIKTVGELLQQTPSMLLGISGFGPSSMHELQEYLEGEGLALAEEKDLSVAEQMAQKRVCTYSDRGGPNGEWRCHRYAMVGSDRCHQHQRDQAARVRLVPRLLRQLHGRRSQLVSSIEEAQANLAEIDEAIALLSRAMEPKKSDTPQ